MTVMLVTLLCWRLIWDVGGRIIMLLIFFVMLVILSMYLIGHQHPESVTNISNLSPTHLASNFRHQHRRRLNLHVGDKICWGKLQNISDRFDFCCQTIVASLLYVTYTMSPTYLCYKFSWATDQDFVTNFNLFNGIKKINAAKIFWWPQ